MADISVIQGVFAMALLVAAAFDVLWYRIPNLVVLFLLLLFVGLSIANYEQVDLVSHIGAGGALFAVGVAFYALGQMGAGDVKLLGATALWAGLSALVPLVFWIAVASLIVLLLLLLLRAFVPLLQGFGVISETRVPKVLGRGGGIPYGAPIAVGTILTMPEFPLWLWQI